FRGQLVNFDTAFLLGYVTKRSYNISPKFKKLRAGVVRTGPDPKLPGRRRDFSHERSKGTPRAPCESRPAGTVCVSLERYTLCCSGRRASPRNRAAHGDGGRTSQRDDSTQRSDQASGRGRPAEGAHHTPGRDHRPL